MTYMKFLTIHMMMYLSVLGLMSNNWLTIWILMEIVFVFCLGLMTLGKNYGVAELMMKYFIVQAGFSIMLFLSILYYMFNICNSNNFIMLLFLFVKLGLFPLHFWFISILGKLDWISFYFLISLVKVLPVIMCFYLMILGSLEALLFGSLVVGSLAGINNLMFQKVLGYSSMVHMCWMFYGLTLSMKLFYMYIVMYFLLLGWFTWSFMISNCYFVSQFKFISFGLGKKFFMFVFVLILAGFPPFMGFIMKWLIISSLLVNSGKFMVLAITWFSVFSMFYYIQLYYYLMLLSSYSVKWFSLELLNLSFLSFVVLGFYGVLFIVY